jgi:hypothetical protein
MDRVHARSTVDQGGGDEGNKGGGKRWRGGNGSVAPEARSWAAQGGREAMAVRPSSGGRR